MSSAGEWVGLTGSRGRVDDGADYDRDFVDDREAIIAPRLARAIVVVVFCGFAGSALLWAAVDLEKGAGEMALAVACLSGLLGFQYFYFCRPSTSLRSRRSYAMLAAQACLAYLPLPVLGASWISQPSFLAGNVLLVLPRAAAWPAFAAIVAGAGLAQYVVNGLLRDVVYILVNTATAGLFVYGLTRLGRLVTALHQARDELATTAVAHERLRFAHDMHDLLGTSLSAIAPKGELALRLMGRRPERAKQELLEIIEIAQRTLANMRALAHLYREISLDDEATFLVSMFAAADVDLRVDLDLSELPPHTQTALRAVLREGVASVLLYRNEEQCEVILLRRGDSVLVDIVNETSSAALAARSIENLATMVSTVAGELTVESDADGRRHLRIAIPVTGRPPELPPEAAAEPRESAPYVATRFASGLVVAVLCGLLVQAYLRLFYLPDVPDPGELVLIFACLCAAVVLQMTYFSRPGTRLRSGMSYVLLVLLALLVCLPWLLLQPAWTGLPGMVAGSALLVLRPALGWLVFVVVASTVAWAQIRFASDSLRFVGQETLITIDLGLIIYGLTWMARTVHQLRTTRQALAEAALAEARLRFARDLHDLLGLSLSAITLKTDLAYKLMVANPARARTELAEVLVITRNALADVRSVASGVHEMSLAEECRTAESLLVAAGMDVQMDVPAGTDYDDLPTAVSTVLATVLREGVTNVLRHSKGGHCQITIAEREGDVLLHIVNDGATKPENSDHQGRGIGNMFDRVTALHGVLTAGPEDNGRFELRARLPAL